ncbi:hypothetical protein MHU86_19146 [Fragilaria crotonensis]|nr:hypothetical protein MHU86_19146 [Fragilaria crotonensis]
MPSLVDKLLEAVIPTTRDIANVVPSLPRFDVRLATRSFVKWMRGAGSVVINAALTRILKNPQQSVAIFFLLGMGALFTMDHKQYPASSNSSMRGSPSITTKYSLDDEEEDETNLPLPQHAPLVNLPLHFNYLAINNATLRATPVFWSLPRSGGGTIKDIMGKCRGMVIAGAWIGTADKLQIVFENGMKQVSADLSTKENRFKARDQGLKDVNPHLFVLTQNVLDTSDIFPGSYQAELWTWFRHPVERQISYYFWLKSLPIGHLQYYPFMQVLSLTDWAQTPLHVPNAMISSLLGVPINRMGWTEMDLAVAMNLLRQKAKIGLLEQKAESFRRLLLFNNAGASGARDCQERMLDYAWPNMGHHATVGKKSNAYQLLLQSNSLDMKLYEYASFLFDLQAGLFVEVNGNN